MIKTAVIMATGLGTRFGNRTKLIPKNFIEVSGKIVRSIENFISVGIEKIIIGTGYKKEVFEELVEQYLQKQCYYSEFYVTINSGHSIIVGK